MSEDQGLAAPCIRSRWVRPLATVTGIALLGLSAACGADDPAVTTAGPTDETSSGIAFSGVYIDPGDPHRLIVGVAECTTDARGDVEEGSDELLIRISGTIQDPPCVQERLELRLEAPFRGQRAVDATNGRTVDVVEAAWLEPYAPPPRLPADCSAEATREAVEREVDGGLRGRTRSCDEQWLVIDTSSDACPATGELPEEGCQANQHTAYFRNVGHWQVFAFDDCDAVRREEPTFPDDRCVSRS